MNSELDVINYCRTCMGVNKLNMFCIFETQGVLDLLQMYTNIKFKSEDKLPKSICEHCFEKFKEFDVFRKSVENCNDELLKIVTYNTDIKLETSNETEMTENVEDDLIREFEDNSNLYTETNKNIENIITIEVEKIKSTPKKSYKCNLCRKGFAKRSILLEHIKNIHKQKNVCETCSTICLTPFALSVHSKLHHTRLPCSICPKTFKHLNHFKSHMQTHNKEVQTFNCNLCNKVFNCEKMLYKHTTEHKKEQKTVKHKCPKCSEEFSKAAILNRHLLNEHDKKNKTLLCPTCGKYFNCTSNLNEHMKRHLENKPFACPFCPGTYATKGDLRQHSSTHTGSRPFTCDTCGSSFTKKGSLTKHKMIHLGIKPYSCDSCHMKFTLKYQLRRHETVHTGEKAYKCDICERAFTTTNVMLRHKKTHFGGKLYKCVHCPERFRLKQELRDHTAQHYQHLNNAQQNIEENNTLTQEYNIEKTQLDTQNQFSGAINTNL